MDNTRRVFLAQMSVAAAGLGLGGFAAAQDRKKVPFQISLAQWTINKELKAGDIDNLDFAKVAHDHGIFAVEYVNQFFMDKAKDAKYLAEMKERAADLGVKSVLIMCDREGNIGDPNDANENKPSKTIASGLTRRSFLAAIRFASMPAAQDRGMNR